MEPKIYTTFSSIIHNINFSVSSVLYERFKLERTEVQTREQPLEDEEEDEDEDEDRKLEENSDHKKGFFNDLLWMLEYNNNGFMQLIICFVHILLLTSQVITSFLYVLLPTEQDPITEEFINPVLRYAEYLSIIDFIHKFDVDGRYNLLIGLSTLQFLVLRWRALIQRFKQANANKYRYKKLNVVEFDLGYASEARFSQTMCFKTLWAAFRYHKCAENIYLTGESRRATLKFNKLVRGLSKIDRIYYYNQIDFNNCWGGDLAFNDYNKKIEQINRKLLNEKVSLQASEKTKFSWFTYLFCMNLPNKISYVAAPEHRIHIKPGVVFTYSLYFASKHVLLIATPCLCILATLTSLKYQNWSRYSWFGCLFGLSKTNLTVMFVCANIYDCTLLTFCSILLSSRSRRIVKLLKSEIEFYRLHLRKLSKIYIRYKCLENFRNKCANLPTITTGFTRRFEDIYSQIDCFKNDNNNLLLFEHQQQQQHNKFSEFSFIRRQQTSADELTKIYHSPDGIDQDPPHELILDYRENLNREKLSQFNENISYLLDLVEVIQIEFNDHKRFFTFILDVNVIFGTLGCSVTLSILFSSTDSISIFFIILGGLLCFLSMICSLIIGASGEASVSYLPLCIRTSNNF